ncbi:DUF2199 domain-containing protein [Pendulispora brunnea]|uniref:DUF2199 domain-containing protein n=1 Tax=Pendulispora brunnea TaxID=2905690 RepID=A0ABZ2JW55_9BACT
MGYQCAVCRSVHVDLPDIGADKPDSWWDVPEEQRERRVQLTSDTCIIDNEHFFIRGVIEIPIHHEPGRFGFGVWVSQKKENFEHYLQNFDSDEIGPFFGWLCTSISYYPGGTLHLKTMAHFRGKGLRPLIMVEPTEHPLSVHQRFGLPVETAWDIVHHYVPPN